MAKSWSHIWPLAVHRKDAKALKPVPPPIPEDDPDTSPTVTLPAEQVAQPSAPLSQLEQVRANKR